ncbi:condensation domain-containing protein [Krasilnikovia cinnamomea]|uniref:Condensation domain-containing protein n=1 Tax=Krasilnikovia cinnamomea TaxID=349313 RepID=A0A4Q7ZRA5_9ACTN|nr:condensation domain-containing protein [Krasilnikovia cinnamomea]RZU53344.1 condensation domain-containing protein [Krasilnikovia cinnamomea]
MTNLTRAQQRIWYQDQLAGPTRASHVAVLLRLHGDLDEAALCRAFGDVTSRYDVLRSRYPAVGGHPYRDVMAPEDAPVVTLVDCAERELAAALDAAGRRPFDLTAAAPVRAVLFRIDPPRISADGPRAASPDRWALLLVAHRIVWDGAGLTALVGELGTAYAARRDGAAPVWPVVAAPPRRGGGTEETDGLRYWREELAALPVGLPLPYDRAHPPVASNRGESVPLDLCPVARERLAELVRTGRARPATIGHAALAALLTRLGAGTDIPIGTTVSDPAPARPFAAPATTVLLRVDTSGDPSFHDLLTRVRATELAAHAHRHAPLDRLVDRLGAGRLPHSPPPVQVMVVTAEAPVRLSLPNLEVRAQRLDPEVTDCDLTVVLTPADVGAGPAGRLRYATDVFDRATAASLADRLVGLLDAMAAEPDAGLGAVEVGTTGCGSPACRTLPGGTGIGVRG